MKMIKARLYLIALVITSCLFAIFLGKILLELNQKPVAITPSSIPGLNVSQLNQTIKQLDKREKIDYPEAIDLNKVQFGKLEPFNP